uniref:Flowering time control protein FCA n=1 Tax=Kalanchoe fedtschenkoi TaxID=63787 RepID=A0A7N0UGT6_KALFE
MDSNPTANASYYDPPPPGPANFPSIKNCSQYHHYEHHATFSNAPGAHWPDARKRKLHHSNRASFESFAKLYVSQLPRTATEDDIRSVFGQGKILEVVFIKDKRTGRQQGSCFVKFATVAEAERAIRTLHNQYTYPGETESLKVKFADGEHERLGIHGSKLYVNNLHKQATKMEIEELFSKYGDVEDVHVLHDELKNSRGIGFIKFSQRSMAEAAINALNGTYFMKGCDHPLVVRFADPKKPQNGDPRSNSTFRGPTFPPLIHPRRNKLPPTHDVIGGQGLPCHLYQAPMANCGAPMPTHPTNPSPRNIIQVAQKQLHHTAPNVVQCGFYPQRQSSPLMPPVVSYPTNTLQESSHPSTDRVDKVVSPAGILEIHSKDHGLAQLLNEEQGSLQQLNEDRVMLQPQNKELILVQQQSEDQSSLTQQNTDEAFPVKTKCTKSEEQTVGTCADVETVEEPAAHCASPNMPSSLEMISLLDCDWSEHFCPDGHKYYYNSETCESKWEKPVEYASFEKHVLKLIQKETSYSASPSSSSQQVLSSH